MEWETASTRIWFPIDLRATFNPLISGTPAVSNVPSIRQNRAMANWATSFPITGARSMAPSQTRLPCSELTPTIIRVNSGSFAPNPANRV